MEYAVVNVPAAPVRRKPMHRKEMVNQLLFGETVKVLKTKGDLWVKIRSLHDAYEGWMTNTLLEEMDEAGANTMSAFATTDILGNVKVGDKKMNIPVGSSLPFFEGGKGKLGKNEFEYAGNYCKRDEQKPGAELLYQLVMPWLNAPYLWGGRTPLGVDCSGFVQVIYKLMGIDLSRDTWQQAQEGKAVKKFSGILAGDLAFFDNKEDIIHVGILLGNEQIIHSSGKVRVDGISKKGIVNSGTGKKGPRLNCIRRIWQ
ncbi:MAG TPA: C40 family peptidase [Chitinophagaceae bacterium]|nr:C40 family peptidase [Chitinophagaceae bacterium]